MPYWVLVWNETFSYPDGPLCQDSPHENGNWELQANVSTDSPIVGSHQLYSNTNIPAAYDDTTFANYALSTMDFQVTITFRRKDLAAIPTAGFQDYVNFGFGNLNADGAGTPKVVYVQIDYGYSLGFPFANKVNLNIADSNNNEADFTNVAAAWGTTHTLVWQRLAGVTTLAVDGVSLGTVTPQPDYTQITLNNVFIYFSLDATTQPESVLLGVQFAIPQIGNFLATKIANDVVRTWTAYAGANHYKISKDGGAYGANVTSPSMDTGAAGASHTYIVQAYDASGKVLAQATAVSPAPPQQPRPPGGCFLARLAGPCAVPARKVTLPTGRFR